MTTTKKTIASFDEDQAALGRYLRELAKKNKLDYLLCDDYGYVPVSRMDPNDPQNRMVCLCFGPEDVSKAFTGMVTFDMLSRATNGKMPSRFYDHDRDVIKLPEDADLEAVLASQETLESYYNELLITTD